MLVAQLVSELAVKRVGEREQHRHKLAFRPVCFEQMLKHRAHMPLPARHGIAGNAADAARGDDLSVQVDGNIKIRQRGSQLAAIIKIAPAVRLKGLMDDFLFVMIRNREHKRKRFQHFTCHIFRRRQFSDLHELFLSPDACKDCNLTAYRGFPA